ncbi:HAMP domain-containing histidine kinase [Crocinitomicaceae bacterium]|nr:HAMP domain-containing histidine kinase [Crocinitomicaceae bacterium]MDG2464139.1 HAMP domain-containing sensor histidine kinase [Crocinitomicaceae bacterium]
MRKARINIVSLLVGTALFSLLVIQAVQVGQLYNRKNYQFKRKLSTSLEKIALQHEKSEDIQRYMQIVNKDFSGQYRDVLKEEFQNLLSLNESISIKDTSILEPDGLHDYLVVKGRSFDSLTGITAEHKVLARDVRQLRELFDQQKKTIPQNDSVAVAIQLDQKVLQQMFKKAKFVNEMLIETFRSNVYLQPFERIDIAFLDSVIKNELSTDELPQEYQFMIEGENTLPVVFPDPPKTYNVKIDTSLTVSSRTQMFPSNMLEDHLTLHVYFPKRNAFILREMLGTIGFSLALMLIIVITIVFMFRTILAQKRLSDLKNDFVNNMTHEFKTPISTISLACEAMSDSQMMGTAVEKASPYVKMIGEENKRLSLLVESILQSNVLEKGKINLQEETILLNELVYDITQNVQLRVNSLGGTLKTNISQEMMEVSADKMHLSNCINNLIDNAIKYSAEAPAIAVTVKKEKNSIRIEVKDNGIGIKKEHIDKIFDKLFRVPTGNVHNVKGFGLGLSYVKSIAEMHKWNLTVKSIYGEGSTFGIEINTNT